MLLKKKKNRIYSTFLKVYNLDTKRIEIEPTISSSRNFLLNDPKITCPYQTIKLERKKNSKYQCDMYFMTFYLL